MTTPDHISESLETIFWVKILKFFDADPVSWMEKFGSGMEKIRNGISVGKRSLKFNKTWWKK